MVRLPRKAVGYPSDGDVPSLSRVRTNNCLCMPSSTLRIRIDWNIAMAHEPTVCCGWATTEILHFPLVQWVNHNRGINKRNLCFSWSNRLNYGTTLKLLTNHGAARPVTMLVHGRSTLDRVETPAMATLERHRAQVDGCQGCSLSFIKPLKILGQGQDAQPPRPHR